MCGTAPVTPPAGACSLPLDGGTLLPIVHHRDCIDVTKKLNYQKNFLKR